MGSPLARAATSASLPSPPPLLPLLPLLLVLLPLITAEQDAWSNQPPTSLANIGVIVAYSVTATQHDTNTSR